MKLLVTGGAGFIGSALILHLLEATPHEVVNIDCLTYAACPSSLQAAVGHPRYAFEAIDIREPKAVARALRRHRPDAILHLAAESHVDRSIADSDAFIQTNVVGTHRLLEAARTYYATLDATARGVFRFHHVSTDEVHGSAEPDDLFTEQSQLSPNSPYAASKAAADDLVRVWHDTYGLPTLITASTNNYGPRQHPEKLIPRIIIDALAHRPIALYGDGRHVRDWMHVEDHVRALRRATEHGRVGERYNIGALAPKTNLEIATLVCDALDTLVPNRGLGSYARLITFVADRKNHDRRYALDPSRIMHELDWQPERGLEDGIRDTVRWYLNNPQWINDALGVRGANRSV
ncbi:dTDP-glucose 4,6-dehydratase [Salinisphaera orenii]|uniref:dTDP-glucose 4,6-dehydratase n=1 Tax=Salinisphaera orenii YIM 95161 TaxID=1051139 RepID=A0A423Q1J9_9GAMM|nr:dTDP-glucose 4,6-dehydratase [Salinisphaera halophila]ROO32370.1 dTDP-glucose 4,6-dehydratase [Salinisphaera halophila YIM 95161]